MRARPGFVAVLAIALAGFAGGGYAARALLSPTTSRTSDTFLAIASASNMGPQPAFTGVATFQPETGGVEPLLDTSWQPVVSPEWTTEPSAGMVHVLDASTGAEFTTSRPLPHAPVRSIDELYGAVYGHSLAQALAPTSPPVASVASMLVSAEPRAGRAGDLVQLETRFVDPRTGEVVQPGQSGPQFLAPQIVTVRLVGSSENVPQPVALHQSEFGIFRGALPLPFTSSNSPGTWTVQTEAIWADGTRRDVDATGALSVQASFTGTDGREYVLSPSTEPAQLRQGLDAVVTVAVLDARTSAPLPDGVELGGGIPSQLEVAGFGNGVTTRLFDQIGHGVYSGTLNLWSAGPWQLWAAVPDGQGHTGRYLIGTLRVVAP